MQAGSGVHHKISISARRIEHCNDVSAALNWLQNGLAVSGVKKVAKIALCTAGEGLVGACGMGSFPGGVHATLVELVRETDRDFVSRNVLHYFYSKCLTFYVLFMALTAEFPAGSGSSTRRRRTFILFRESGSRGRYPIT